jgi:hypothetical protein
MDVIRQQVTAQATCCVCQEVRIPIYGCSAGCTGVTCGPCRELPGFDLTICPTCRGKQQRGGTRNRQLENIVTAMKLVETDPAEAQAAPAVAHAATPATAARATGESEAAAAAAATAAAPAAAPAAAAQGKQRRAKESHGADSTRQHKKRKRAEHKPAGRKRTQQQPAPSAASTAAAAAPATAAAAADPMKLIKAEQEGFYVGKQVWVFFPDHGQRFVGKVTRRCEDHELHESEDGLRTCFWQIAFDDGTTMRCSTSDLTQGVMNKLMPPYLVQGYRRNFTVYFDAKVADTLMSVRLTGPQKLAPVKVVRDRFLFTNSVVVSVLGGNGMDTFRHPARGNHVQYLSDQSVHVQPGWNPRMPKHAGCNGFMLLKSKHGMEGMQTVPLFTARGPTDAAKDYNTTRKWEYCGNYTVPTTDGDGDDDDDAVIDQVEFVAMGPHLNCPHCHESHSLFRHLQARDVDTNTGRLNKFPNQILEFHCPKATAAPAPTTTTPSKKKKTDVGGAKRACAVGAVKVILVDHGFPIDDSLKVAGTDKLLPGYCVYKKGGTAGGRTAQQKIVDRGALATDYGFSTTYLSSKSAQIQQAFCYGKPEKQMDAQMKEKRRRKYFELLDSGEIKMQWIPFRFKEYDECLFELLCAAEAEHQLDRKATGVNVRSAVARQNVQMVDIYKGLRKALIADGCSAYKSGRYLPPQLEVTSGGQRNASECDGL